MHYLNDSLSQEMTINCSTHSLCSVCAPKYLREELLKAGTALVFGFLRKEHVQSIHYLTQAVIPHHYCPDFGDFLGI